MHQPSPPQPARARTVAVLLPCYNEAVTVGGVVADFRAALPSADIYVFDNASDDETARVAAAAGATVVYSPRRGKGFVVKHMLDAVDADVYVIADGDGTYPAAAAPELIRALDDSRADMVVGTRLGQHARGAFRPLHEAGNRVVSRVVSALFSARVTDVLSGYRVLGRRFARALHLQAGGFEVETEMTLQALMGGYRLREVPVRYGARPAGSTSKLSTFSDGALVLFAIVLILRDYKPLAFFSTLSALCFVLGLVAGWYPVNDYIHTRYVNHVPLALLAAALEVLAALFLGIGLILSAIRRFHVESMQRIGDRLGPRDEDER